MTATRSNSENRATNPVHVVPGQSILRTVTTAGRERGRRIDIGSFADRLIRERGDRLTASVEVGLRCCLTIATAIGIDGRFASRRRRISRARVLTTVVSTRIARVVVSTVVVPSSARRLVVVVLAVDVLVVVHVGLRERQYELDKGRCALASDALVARRSRSGQLARIAHSP